MQPHEVRLGLPYRCTVETAIGRLRAKFVPTARVGGSAWGPVFLGRAYISHDGEKRAGNRAIDARYFADELEPWNGVG